MAEIPANIFIGDDALDELFMFLFSDSFSHIFILVDENTKKHCYPKLAKHLPNHTVIQIKSGEKNKTLASCEIIWNKLTGANADRNSLLVNVGGGVIGDTGGFAAGCYKRGIKFINVPTTLLAMVDASVGAKTGVDFKNFKNQIGLFNEPEAVFIHTGFLETLPDRELRSGMAEVVKHYLIADKQEFQNLSDLLFPQPGQELYNIRDMDWDVLVGKNIAIKAAIVSKDKFETGERKALNFAHTIGHAIETYFLNRGKKILHGEAVMLGIICECSISVNAGLMPREYYPYIVVLTGVLFPSLPFFRKQSIPSIFKLIQQDKKNTKSKNQFTLLNGIGDYVINQEVEEELVISALSYCSELTYEHKI